MTERHWEIDWVQSSTIFLWKSHRIWKSNPVCLGLYWNVTSICTSLLLKYTAGHWILRTEDNRANIDSANLILIVKCIHEQRWVRLLYIHSTYVNCEYLNPRIQYRKFLWLTVCKYLITWDQNIYFIILFYISCYSRTLSIVTLYSPQSPIDSAKLSYQLIYWPFA